MPAQVKLRPERSIYRIDGGWFKARWHFSFDRYSDPNNMGIGTLRVFSAYRSGTRSGTSSVWDAAGISTSSTARCS